MYKVMKMTRSEIIEYLNNSKKYLKLSRLCEEYNFRNPKNAIDYNNLRTTLNNQTPNRLSTDKLVAFYDFLTKDILHDEFLTKNNLLKESEIKKIIKNSNDDLTNKILEVIGHGI